MRWRRLGRLCLTVHGEQSPTDEEWTAYLAGIDRHVPLHAQRVLVVSAGGAPSSAQRKRMVDALEGAQVPVAIITSSLLMRGAGIAVSWFNPFVEVFAPHQLARALDHLGLTEWQRAEVPRILAQLESELEISVIVDERRVA
ncbi:MAG: hypothetical protein KC619_29145 [Myxococcales bacterium]|nr:hypothetical protein [Myxococcales bacterium]